ncbi:MAG: hypothetical protein RLZZ506_119, partial [Bacteroidota bacterium]
MPILFSIDIKGKGKQNAFLTVLIQFK